MRRKGVLSVRTAYRGGSRGGKGGSLGQLAQLGLLRSIFLFFPYLPGAIIERKKVNLEYQPKSTREEEARKKMWPRGHENAESED